jgi:polyisoprenoid-binding protein YceI
MKKITALVIGLFSLAGIHAQDYQPVDDKSAVKFTIKNFGVNTGGSFKGLEGNIVFDKANPGKTAFAISINTATVNTGNDARDNHLRKEEYFDAGKFPKISFTSEKVSARGAGFTVTGQLSIKGTSRTVSIPFTATEVNGGYLFEGSFQLNRRHFKVGGNSMVLGDNVRVSLSVQAKKK